MLGAGVWVGSTPTTFTPSWTVGTPANIDKNFGQYWKGTGPLKGCMVLDIFMNNKTGTLGSGGIVILTLPNSLAVNTSWWSNNGIVISAGMNHGLRPYFGRGLQFNAVNGSWDVCPIGLYDTDTTNKSLQFFTSTGLVLDTYFTLNGSAPSSITIQKAIIPIQGW